MGVGKQRIGALDDTRFGIFLRWHGQNQERAKYDDDVFYNHWNSKCALGFLWI